MWCYRIKTSLPITEEALKPVTPPKGIYLIHICSQFYVIYTNYFKSIFLSISGFLFHHFPDFSLLCCSFTVNSWQWKKKKFLITFWQVQHVSSESVTQTSLVMFSDFFFMSSDLSKNLPAELQKAKNILLFPKLTPWLSHHGAAAGKKQK